MRDWNEEFNHRAAILEYDACYPREEAERLAKRWVEIEKAREAKKNKKE